MAKIQKNEKGFTMVEVLLVVLVLVIIGGAGYFVAKHVDSKNTSLNSTAGNTTTNTTKPITSTPATTTPAKTVNQLALASSKVTFTIPANWTKIENSPPTTPANSCSSQQDSVNLACVDGGAIVPNGVGKNSDGSNLLILSASVYKLTDGKSPTDWFQDDYKGSLAVASEGDTTSTQAINGYTTYVLRRKAYTEVEIYYIYEAKGYVVMVQASSQTDTNSTPQATTYEQYVPAITSFADSVNIAS